MSAGTRTLMVTGDHALTALVEPRDQRVGLVLAAGTLLTFRWVLDDTGDLDTARTAALTTMVLFQAFHLGNARSERVSVFRMNPSSNRQTQPLPHPTSLTPNRR